MLLALPTIDQLAYEDLGIIEKNVSKALEVNDRLNHDLGLGLVQPTPVTNADLPAILRCIVAGQLHQIWSVEPWGEAKHIVTGQIRELSSSSVVRRGGLVCGTPFDLEVPMDRGGLQVLHLVNEATIVDPLWLPDLAPDMFNVRLGKKYFDSHMGMLVNRVLLTINNKIVEVPGAPVLERTPDNQKLFIALYAKWVHEQLEKERHSVRFARPRIPEVPIKQVQNQIRHIAPGAITIAELSKKQRVELSKLTKLESYLGEKYKAALQQRQHHSRHTFRRHGWQPKHKRKPGRHNHERYE